MRKSSKNRHFNPTDEQKRAISQRVSELRASEQRSYNNSQRVGQGTETFKNESKKKLMEANNVSASQVEKETDDFALSSSLYRASSIVDPSS